MTVTEEGLLEPVVIRCPECNSLLSISPDWKVYVFWRLVLGHVLGRVLMPLFYLDAAIWVVANTISKFSQKRLHLSKYLLALGSYVLGLTVMFTTQAMKAHGISILPFALTALWTFYCYDYLKWCWRKIKEGDQEDGDVLIQNDVVMRKRSRVLRITLMGLIAFIFPLTVLTGDTINLLDLFLISLGHYFVDSDFVPPSKRSILDLSQRWVGNEV